MLLLPPSVQSSLPSFLLPLAPSEEAEVEPVQGYEIEAPVSRKNRRGKKSASATPRDSPATTELSSDEVDTEGGATADEKKKKKRGPGKASGMHRRKLALKK